MSAHQIHNLIQGLIDLGLNGVIWGLYFLGFNAKPLNIQTINLELQTVALVLGILVSIATLIKFVRTYLKEKKK